MIQLKCPTEPAQVKSYLLKNFFRDTTGTTSRASDFDEIFSDAVLYDFKYNCAALNPERFHIITHRKKVLLPYSAETGARNKDHWKIHKYFRMKKKIVFEDMDTQIPKNPIYEVFWCNHTSSEGWTKTQNKDTQTPIEVNKYNTVYFRETL